MCEYNRDVCIYKFFYLRVYSGLLGPRKGSFVTFI